MSKKEMRQVYPVVKVAILAVSLMLLIGGLHYMCLDGYEGTSALCWWLSGLLMWSFATLEE